MKITTINVVPASELPTRRVANTEANQNVRQILENLSKIKPGQGLVIAGEDIKKFERYSLQKKLQKAGAHVTVGVVEHHQTKKPMLTIHPMTDAEWREYISQDKPGPKAVAAKK